ncbi:MAG TPA: hypothetical protein VNV41_04385 [Candidatus Acidoferrales bacterium]|jgi:hypothetical protein|nr:hypothetical protein [Candidatus Acidoferrales bacterium]
MKTVGKVTLGVFVTILLSALGNAFWQYLLEPTLHALTRGVLNVASLGLSSYKNGIYQRIATDNPSTIVLDVLGIVLSVQSLAFGVGLGYLVSSYGDARKQFKQLEEHSKEPPANDPEVSTETLPQTLQRLRGMLGTARWFTYVTFVLAICILVSDFIALARGSYVNSADAHYHQVFRIASPNLDAHEQAQIESDFAQIGSRDDYIKVLSKLEGECKAHGQTVPAFNPW